MVKKILIVEDDIILSMATKHYVESLGHKVVRSVRNGLDAIAGVKKYNPDVILMDIRIEGEMDGIEVMEQIQIFSDVKAIYLTGNSEPTAKQRAEKTNMLAFCIKPVSIEDIKVAMEKCYNK